MPSDGYLSLPYVPNRQRKLKKGRPSPHAYIHRIAYTETMRGIDDDIPTLLFIGAPWMLLRDVCVSLVKMMDGHLKDITLQLEHSCRVKNGKHYWRIAVGIIDLDERLISYSEFVKLLVSKILYVANCSVRHFRLETFLNL